jgi:hypothetical protein
MSAINEGGKCLSFLGCVFFLLFWSFLFAFFCRYLQVFYIVYGFLLSSSIP